MVSMFAPGGSRLPALPFLASTAGSFAAGLGRAACLLVMGLILWGGITNPLGSRVPAIAAGLLLAALAGWAFGSRSSLRPASEQAWSRAGLFVLCTACVLGFAWVLAFDSNQSSDFGIYYRCGTSLKQGLHAWMESCRSNYFYQPDYTYWSRALVYSAPFGLVFGDNYPAFKLYNATLHAATLALLFFGVRQLAGARAALVALLVLGLYPEWFFSLTVATPDHLAVGLVIGFLLLAPALARAEGARGWLLALVLAAIAFVANLARTVGPFLIISLVLGTLVSLDRSRWKASLLRAAAVVVLYGLANAALVAAVGKPVQGQFAFVQRISTIDLHEPLQNYRLVFGWLDQFLPVVPEAARGKVAAQKIVSEFAQGFANYPGYLLAKARVFSEGTGYYLYASTDAGANPDSARTAAAFTVPVHPAMPVVLAAIVLFMALLTAFALLRARRGLLADTSVFFVAAICTVILGLGDTQQRYSVLIAPAMAIIAGLAFTRAADAGDGGAAGPGNLPSDGLPPIATHIVWTVLGLAAIVATYLVGSGVAAAVAVRIPQPLAEARQESPFQHAGVTCNAEKVELQGNYKRLRALPSGRGGCFTIRTPLPAGAQSVSFFLSRDEFPFPFEPKTASPYVVKVEYGKDVLYEGSLGRDTVHWHQFVLPRPAGAVDDGLRFIVTPTVAGSKEPVNLWWLTPSSRPGS